MKGVAVGKKKLTPVEINLISLDYLQAVKLAIHQQAMDQTELTYRRGWFYLRPPGYSRDVPGIPYRPHQIEAMTAELCKRISPRPDSNDDGEPD